MIQEKVGVIHLTLGEMERCAALAVRLRWHARRNGQRDRLNNGRPWDSIIEGFAAECAYAKAHGVPWTIHFNVFNTPDVGDVHVRFTHLDPPRLIVRPRDQDGLYALVVGGDGEYTIMGCKYVVKAELPDAYLFTGPGEPAWFIPADDLGPDL